MFQIDVTAGASVAGTPRLRLPAGTIAVALKNAGAPVAGAELEVHVLEGGGGFNSTATTPEPSSRARVVTDGSGAASLPEFALGPRTEANRLLVQGDHASVVVTVLGSYANTRLRCADPASGS